MNEGKKDRRDPIRTIKTKNPVAKAHQNIGTGSGAHKDKKKAMKSGEVKHKKKEVAESYEQYLAKRLSAMAEAANGITGPGMMDTRPSEDFDDREYNDEAGMAKNNLHTIVRCAYELDKAIKNNENLPEWVEEKISIAKGMIVTAFDYIRSQHEMGVEPTIDEASALDQHRKRSAQSDADYARREAERKKNPGAASGDRIKELEKRYPAKEGAEGAKTEKQILTRIRQIMYDRKLSGTDSNAGELNKLKQNLKDIRNKQDVSETTQPYNYKVGQQAEYIALGGKLPPFPVVITSIDGDYIEFRSASGQPIPGTNGETEWGADPGWKVLNPSAAEGWTHDSLADRLFEHERTYEEKLQNQLNKLTNK